MMMMMMMTTAVAVSDKNNHHQPTTDNQQEPVFRWFCERGSNHPISNRESVRKRFFQTVV